MSSKTNKAKVRDLVPDYEALIIFLANNGKDIHELEVANNERACVRAKAKLREFRAMVDSFYEQIEGVRKEIVSKKL
jgi:hypothetical protein